MFITQATKFKCPHCNNEYERIVGYGENYEYKDNIYHYEVCRICNMEFLDNGNEAIKMPKDKNELKYHSSWIS